MNAKPDDEIAASKNHQITQITQITHYVTLFFMALNGGGGKLISVPHQISSTHTLNASSSYIEGIFTSDRFTQLGHLQRT